MSGYPCSRSWGPLTDEADAADLPVGDTEGACLGINQVLLMGKVRIGRPSSKCQSAATSWPLNDHVEILRLLELPERSIDLAVLSPSCCDIPFELVTANDTQLEESEWIAEINRVAIRESIEIQPSSEANRVFLREIDRLASLVRARGSLMVMPSCSSRSVAVRCGRTSWFFALRCAADVWHAPYDSMCGKALWWMRGLTTRLPKLLCLSCACRPEILFANLQLRDASSLSRTAFAMRQRSILRIIRAFAARAPLSNERPNFLSSRRRARGSCASTGSRWRTSIAGGLGHSDRGGQHAAAAYQSLLVIAMLVRRLSP
jgi:hypothetical protein